MIFFLDVDEDEDEDDVLIGFNWFFFECEL